MFSKNNAIAPAMVAVMLCSNAFAEESDWWHGRWVDEKFDDCGYHDSQKVFTATKYYPWETECDIKLQTNIRDTRGVILDFVCGFPDSPDEEGYSDREILLELSDGKLLTYSRQKKESSIFRRCPVE